MTWFHAPLLTPAQGFVFLMVLIAIQVLSYLFHKLWKDAGKARPDPLSEAHGEVVLWHPRDSRQNLRGQSHDA